LHGSDDEVHLNAADAGDEAMTQYGTILATVLVAAAVGFGFQNDNQERPAEAQPSPGPTSEMETADRDAIIKSARDFAAAFNRADAKTAAAMYTEKGESREDGGAVFVGRGAIEKALAESFKANPGVRMEVIVKSVRFPSKDMAVEEGLLRLSRGPMGLPESTSYVAIHARESGAWKMAMTTEYGGGIDRLENLEWLLGDWTTQAPSGAITFSFSRDPKAEAVNAKFTRTPQGKEPVTGNIRIVVDPATGRIHSSGSEDNGSYSHAAWTCDGKSWILDVQGFTAFGAPTAERILLHRAAPDAITWRAVNRVMGSAVFPDTIPLRLTRVAAAGVSQ